MVWPRRSHLHTHQAQGSASSTAPAPLAILRLGSTASRLPKTPSCGHFAFVEHCRGLHTLAHDDPTFPATGTKQGYAGAADPSVGGTRGFADVRRSVTLLNHHVVSALVRHGLPAVAMGPFPAWACTNGQLMAQDGMEGVKQALGCGLLPVLHGDAVLDTEIGCTILGYHPPPAPAPILVCSILLV